MKRYKEEVDALQASDALRQSIAALPAQSAPSAAARKKPGVRRYASLAAVLVVILAVGVIGVPSVFLATRKAGNMAAQDSYYSAAESKNGFPEDTADGFSYGGSEYEYPAEANASGKNDAANLPAGRKLIRNADLDVETKDYDRFMTDLTGRLTALNGYIQSTESGTIYNGSRYCTMVLRVPAASLDAFLAFIGENGNVISESTSVQDVTDDYIDIESRIKALETEQQTLLDLLEKADTLTDTLEIQDRLSEVRGTLESYKGRLKALDSQIDYSAVTVRLSEVERVTAPEGKTFFQQVRQNLEENLYNIGQGLRNFGIGFLSGLPYIFLWLLLIGIVVLIVVLIVRKVRKKRS